MDGHSSHDVLEILEKAKEKDIHIVALPPHTTQQLQPTGNEDGSNDDVPQYGWKKRECVYTEKR